MAAILSLADVESVEGEPRILDLRLAEALEFKAAFQIRELIKRNVGELEEHGSLSYCTINPGSQGGRPSSEYWLNEAQAVTLCALSKTRVAREIRVHLVKVFVAYRHGELVPIVGPSIQQIGEMFDDKLAPVHDRIAKIEDNVTYIAQRTDDTARRVDDMVPRHPFPKEHKRVWRLVVRDRYDCRCPCCRTTKIVDAGAQPISGEIHYDHFNGREKTGIGDGWPVCPKCNLRLENEDGFKRRKKAQFDAFHDTRNDLVMPPEKKKSKNKGSATIHDTRQGALKL